MSKSLLRFVKYNHSIPITYTLIGESIRDRCHGEGHKDCKVFRSVFLAASLTAIIQVAPQHNEHGRLFPGIYVVELQATMFVVSLRGSEKRPEQR